MPRQQHSHRRVSARQCAPVRVTPRQFYQTQRSITRLSTAARKTRESDEQGKMEAELKAKITDLKAGRKESLATEKVLQAELKALKGGMTSGRSKQGNFAGYGSVVVSASSSGRVKTKMVPIKAAGLRTTENGTDALPSAAQPPSQPALLSPGHDSGPSNLLFETSSMDFMLDTPPVQTSPMFDFDILTSDWFSNAPSISYGSACDFNVDASVSYDGSYLDLNGFLDNTPMTAEIPTGFEDLFPPVGFAAGPSSSVADHDYLQYDWSALTPANELPTLPAPPASTPSPSVYHAPSPEPPISAKGKGKRKEVDEENIVTTRRNRRRVIVIGWVFAYETTIEGRCWGYKDFLKNNLLHYNFGL
ncbi:hypothetical protein B0H19DRAFT_1261300 [Mycena capillaripes]|nr:hypothetical protein B0H19DRAFT_1261300 [Mycena capillaripes]